MNLSTGIQLKLTYLFLDTCHNSINKSAIFFKYYKFSINYMLCKVRTSASVAFINSPSITSLNYASALISHAKCSILHRRQQSSNSEKDPTVYASSDKKIHFFFTLPSAIFVRRYGINVQKLSMCTLSS